MPNNKEIKIKWVSDDSSIEQSINRMKQKLSQMNQTMAPMQKIQESSGQLSPMAKRAQAQYQKYSTEDLQRQSRELEVLQRKESLNLLTKQRELRQIQTSEGKITAEKQKQVDLLKEEIMLKSRNIMGIESLRQNISSKTNQLTEGSTTGAAVGGNAGGVSDRKAMSMFKDLLKSIGVASIINGALNLTQHRLERDRKLLADQGQTAQMAARELREQVGGEGVKGLYFAEERSKAMQMAAREQRGMGALDFARLAGGTAAGAVAGGIGGSFIPGIGTAIGAVAGGIGAFGGMMGSSARLYNRAFDQQAYRSMLTREGMQKYEANKRMLQLQNPLKMIAYETMQNNTDNFLGMERTLGLQGRELYGTPKQTPVLSASVQDILNTPQSANIYGLKPTRYGAERVVTGKRFPSTGTSPLIGGLTGTQNLMDIIGQNQPFNMMEQAVPEDRLGYLRRMQRPYGATQAQFTQKDIEKSIQSLIQAGATTEGAKSMAGAGLQFQRNLRLQNAQEIMGKLQAAGVQGNQTDQAVIKLMSEAVKLGVNASTMPQEMKRMTAITAELSTQGGGFGKGIAQTFAAGVTEFTKTGLEGAKSAYQEMLGRAKTAGGFEGQMGMGFLMGSGAEQAFGKEAATKLKSNSKLMNALNQMSASDLMQDKAAASGFAKQLGISTEDLINGMRKKDEFKQTRTRSQMQSTQMLGEKIKGMSPAQVKTFIEGEGAGLYSKVIQEDIAAYGSTESGKGMAARRASIVGRARRLAGGMPTQEGAEGELWNQLTSPATTPTEQYRVARATADTAKMEALNENLDKLVNAAKKHTVASELYNKQFENFVKFAKESGDALEKMSGQIDQVVDMLNEKGFTAAGQPAE